MTVRVLATATMAASVLAIGLQMDAAHAPSSARPIGDRIGSADGPVQLAQQGEKELSPGQGGPRRGGAGPSMQDGGGKMRGEGLRQGGSQFRPSEKGQGGEFGYRSGGGGKMRGEGLRQGGSQFRSGEKGVRGEHGYRDGGGPAFRPRARGRSGGYIEGDRRHGGRGGVYFGPGYGYRPGYSCAWLRRQAVATGSPYWWRRYHVCRG